MLIPVPEAEPVVSGHRHRLDRAAAWGIPAHVTVLYPFVAPSAISGATIAALADAVRSVSAFDCEFPATAWFGREVVWLAPRPAEPFRALTRSVSAAFPGYLPYGGAYEEVVPHLTVGDRPAGGVTELLAAEADVRRWLPIQARISRVWLMTGHGAPGSWRTIAELSLDTGLPPVQPRAGRHERALRWPAFSQVAGLARASVRIVRGKGMGMGVAVRAGELEGLCVPGPVVLFLGVSTAASAVHRYFPRWAGSFPEPVRLIGIDLPVAAPARQYEDLLDWMARHEQVRGMVITSHKIDLFRAGSGRFAAADRLSAMLGEVSAVRRTPRGDLLAYATDPLSARAATAELNLGTCGGETVCFGAGGAAVALVAALTLPGTVLAWPAPGETAAGGPLGNGEIHLTDVRPDRLAHLMHVAVRLGVAGRVVPHLPEDDSGHTGLLAGHPDARLVVNATGLGKDGPGSPLTDEAVFPRHCVAWDMNYRGPLTFLQQARAQQDARGLRIADGWRFFLHGWTSALARILDVPPGDPALARILDTRRTRAGRSAQRHELRGEVP